MKKFKLSKNDIEAIKNGVSLKELERHKAYEIAILLTGNRKAASELLNLLRKINEIGLEIFKEPQVVNFRTGKSVYRGMINIDEEFPIDNRTIKIKNYKNTNGKTNIAKKGS